MTRPPTPPTPPTPPILLSLAAAALLLAPSTLLAQAGKTGQPLGRGTNAPASDVLRGPAVAEKASAPTLVRRDFSGRVVRLDAQPAEAAAKLLKLDEATRAEVDRILLERSALLDKLVSENLPLLAQLQAAREAGDQNEYGELLGELVDASRPLRDRGVLAQELLAVLPAEQGAELRRLIQEYWRAVVQEDIQDKQRAREMGEEGARVRDRRAARGGGRGGGDALREEMQLIVGGEIRRAYERTIGSAAKDFDDLLKGLNLTPEQDGPIRKLVQDTFTAKNGMLTVADRTALFQAVYQKLTAEQRAELIRRLSPGAAAPAAGAGATGKAHR